MTHSKRLLRMLLPTVLFGSACNESGPQDPNATTDAEDVEDTDGTDLDEDTEGGESTGNEGWVDPCLGHDEATCESMWECIPAYGVQLDRDEGCLITGSGVYFGCVTPTAYEGRAMCVRLDDESRFVGPPYIQVSEELSCWRDNVMMREHCE